MADEATAAATATIGDEAQVATVAGPPLAEAPQLAGPVVVEPGPATKKAKADLTTEQRKIESKKRADRRRALDQRKRDIAAAEERQRAAEQLLQLKTEAKADVMQEHAMLFYGHAALAQHLILPGAGTASGGARPRP
jgi:hypothetical protein